MRSLLADMDSAADDGDMVGLIRLDRAFHFTIFNAAGMPHLSRVIALTWDQSDVYRAIFFADAANVARNREEHQAIFAAVEARDAVRLIDLLDHHRRGPAARVPQLADPPPDGDARSG